MKDLRSDIYKIGFAWLHLFLFFRLVSQATSFARIFVGNFGETIGHVLIILYAIAFFVLFRNLSLVVVNLRPNSEEASFDFLISLGKWTIYLLFLLLLIQIIPEYVLSQRNQLL